MLIIRGIRQLVSYVDFCAEGAFCEQMLTWAAENGIEILFPYKEGYAIKGTVLAQDYKKLRCPAKKFGIRLRIKKKHGAYFWLKRHKDKVGLAAGAVFVAGAVLFLNMFIWEINISGNSTVPTENIMNSLASAGVRTGTLRKSHDERAVEWKILNDNREIAWAAVNIQGCCANVIVTEIKKETEMKYDDDKPVNIVASKYGVIREVSVFDGQGMVKPGDAVMKGDLLVSAAFEDRHGKLTLKHSRAKIMAETDYEITVEFPLEQTITAADEVKKIQKELSVLGSIIPIGSRRGCKGLPFEKEERELYFLWVRLPIKEIKTTYFDVKQKSITYTPEQAKSGALQLLEEREAEEMDDKKIISKKINEKIENGKYIVTAVYDCVMDICEEQDILSDEPWENTDDIS